MAHSTLSRAFYKVKPLIPRSVQLALRRARGRVLLRCARNRWPIDERAGRPPREWGGWPQGKRFAVVLTHDVEWAHGQERCLQLAGLEAQLGFRSCFYIVPERYPLSTEVREALRDAGCEVGVHGLKHDGRLFESHETFMSRAARINAYLREWGAVGFRAPAMHRDLEWLRSLEIEYDASTFDTDPFEPDSEGAGTVFPFVISGRNGARSYVELPYTIPQDHTMFVVMRERDAAIWKQKVDWIAARGGMVLALTHPDYMYFGQGRRGREEYPVEQYLDLLGYIRDRYRDEYWHVLPRDLARYWAEHAAASAAKASSSELTTRPS